MFISNSITIERVKRRIAHFTLAQNGPQHTVTPGEVAATNHPRKGDDAS